jgi:hypothetical protein
MVLHEITGSRLKQKAWAKFAKHHYTPNRFNPASRVFLATESFGEREMLVGLAACLTLPSGTLKSAWRSHKVVVLPPATKTGVWGSAEQAALPDFDRNQLWRELADTQARLIVGDGGRYFCNASDAPPELVAYRNDPASGWRPTSKNGKAPSDHGHGAKFSHKTRATNAAGVMVSYEYVR